MNYLSNFFQNKTILDFDRQKLELFTVTLPENSVLYDLYEWLKNTDFTLPLISFIFSSIGFYGVFYGVYKHMQYKNMLYNFDRERLLTSYIINKSDTGSEYSPSEESDASEDIGMTSEEENNQDLLDPYTITKNTRKTVEDFEKDLFTFEKNLRKKKQD